MFSVSPTLSTPNCSAVFSSKQSSMVTFGPQYLQVNVTTSKVGLFGDA